MKLTRFHNRFIVIGIFLLLIVTSIGQFTTIPAAEAQDFDGMGIQRTTQDIMNAQLLVPEQQTYRIKIEQEVEDRPILPQNPASPPVSATGGGGQPVKGPTQSFVGPRLPQATSTEFTGATLADTFAFPPDTMGAVGPTQFVVGLNGRIRTFNKTTGAADGALNADMDVFFSSAMTPIGGTFTSDPRVRYDHFTDRWIIIMIDVPPSQTNNRIMLAVSNSGTISLSTVWTFFFFQHNLVSTTGDTGCLADYPTLGVDVNALYIGTNQFCPGFSGTAGFVVQKSSILGAGPIVVTAFRNLAAAGGAGPYTPQGVDNYDPSAIEGYFIGVDNFNFGTLALRRVSNPGSTSPTLSGNVFLTVPATDYPLDAPHSGNTQGATGFLDAIDDRLFAAVMRNGHLWTAHGIGVDDTGVSSGTETRTAVRWYELSNLSGTPSLVQSGTIFDPAVSNPLYYWMGTVMVSGQGHAAFGMSASGVGIFPSAATVGRLASDTLGTTQGTPVIYEAGVGAYNPAGDTGAGIGARRWGDYSYTSLDPCDDMTMWTIQEYTNAANSYGVRAVKLLAPPPAVLPGGSLATVITGQSSVSVNLTGTASSGRGFYDPGAGFNCRLTASVTNGVTVNNVTYTDPTHISLDLSTTSATTGAATVTITNPDGQQVTGTITIDTPAPPSNDDFANATTIGSLPYSNTQSTLNSTTQGSEQFPSCGTSPGSTVWYKYVAGASGSVAFNTLGSSFDTVMAVWTGTTLGSLTQVGCSDNAGGQASAVSVNTVGGTTYYIQIGGNNAASGATLNVNALVPPTNNDFANAFDIAALPYSNSQSTVGATLQGTEQLPSCGTNTATTVWYKYVAGASASVTFSTLGSNFDTVLAVWTGAGLGSLSQAGCNDDASGTTSSLSVNVTAATTYYIQISGNNGASGSTLTLNVSIPPVNDNFANAKVIGSLTYSDSAAPNGGTLESGEQEASCTQQPATNSLWYQYTATGSDKISFTVMGSNVNRALSVWTGSVLGSLAPIGCQGGVNPKVTITTSAPTVYYIRVSSWSGATTSSFQFYAALAPANDDFANATDIVPLYTYTDSEDIWGATIESTEPWGACESYPSFGTVWYKYAAAVNQTVIFDTVGSNFNTSLSVWTGNTLSSLVQVGCATNSSSSTITLNLTAGKTYYIKVGRYSGSSADVVFNMVTVSAPNAAPPPNYFTTTTPTLTWNRVNGATGYEIQITTNPNFTGEPISPVGNVLEVPMPLTRGVWYWHVRAKYGTTAGAWSATQTLIVNPP